MESNISREDLDCKEEINLPEFSCKHDVPTTNFIHEDQVTRVRIKDEFEIDCEREFNALELSCKNSTLNHDFIYEEFISKMKIKKYNEFGCNEENSLEPAYKQVTSNPCSDGENQTTKIKIKNEKMKCQEIVNSLEHSYKHDKSKNSVSEEMISGINYEYINVFESFNKYMSDNNSNVGGKINDCTKIINSFKQIKKYMSDDKEKETSLNIADIYDPSTVAYNSENNMQTQFDSSDDSNDFDEETLAMLEPIVKCEVSEDIILLNESQRTGLDPYGKGKISQKMDHFQKLKSAAFIKCTICDATFKSKKRYETHLEKHSLNEKVQCNVCGKAFPYNRFMRHIMVHTGEKPHVCKICARGFRLKRDLKQHSFTHTGERPYPCKMCGKKFADSSARRKHYQTHTGEKPYTCEICQRAFTQISHLREHQVTHTREKGHTCNMCEKKFTTKSSLQRHVSTHINCCEICGETFTTSTKLDRHKELHDSSRPYSCPYCTRRFVKKTDINTHLLIHSEVKDIICKICNGAFKSYRYLRVHHYHYHTGMEPPYVCAVCKKGFFQEMSLQKHSVAHMPKKRVKCFECKKVFTSPEVLEEHVCILDSYFNCEFCDKKYRHKSDLNKHIRKVHQ